MRKLEEELDVGLFDRSGIIAKFTSVGRMLLERGRVLLEAADKLTTDAEALARGLGKRASDAGHWLWYRRLLFFR